MREKTNEVDRRDFLKISAAAGALLSLGAAPTAEKRNGMPYRVLGKTGEKVSLLGLGGHSIGREMVTEKQAIEIMRTAIDEGVNFFDNAWDYTGGKSEERMGKAMLDGYRKKVFLMTKHHGRESETAQKHLEESLRRFQTDVIDLWQFHQIQVPDDAEKIYTSGVLDFALKAQEQGKIRYIGFTGHRRPAYHLDMINRGFDWASVQMPVNVFDHHFMSFIHEVLPVALEKNIGTIAMKVMGGLPGVIPETGSATPEECLRFVINLPVSTVVSGMETIAELRQNLTVAKSFEPMAKEELETLLAKTADSAKDGKFETYKTRTRRS